MTADGKVSVDGREELLEDLARKLRRRNVEQTWAFKDVFAAHQGLLHLNEKLRQQTLDQDKVSVTSMLDTSPDITCLKSYCRRLHMVLTPILARKSKQNLVLFQACSGLYSFWHPKLQYLTLRQPVSIPSCQALSCTTTVVVCRKTTTTTVVSALHTSINTFAPKVEKGIMPGGMMMAVQIIGW